MISKCHGSKWFQSKPFTSPIPGCLPKTGTKQNLPFKVIGADYASPIYFKTKSKIKVKICILLFTCSVSRAIHLEILTNQITLEFIKALKRLIARRGRPQIIYSDSAKTMMAPNFWNVIALPESFTRETLHETEAIKERNQRRGPCHNQIW